MYGTINGEIVSPNDLISSSSRLADSAKKKINRCFKSHHLNPLFLSHSHFFLYLYATSEILSSYLSFFVTFFRRLLNSHFPKCLHHRIVAPVTEVGDNRLETQRKTYNSIAEIVCLPVAPPQGECCRYHLVPTSQTLKGRQILRFELWSLKSNLRIERSNGTQRRQEVQ